MRDGKERSERCLMYRVLMDDREDTASATPSSKCKSQSSAGHLDVLYTTPREMPPAHEEAYVWDRW